MIERAQFMLALVCANCGTIGTIVWEENKHVSPDGPQRRLMSIDGEFHQEDGRTNSGDPVIICNLCDEIQTD